MAGNTEILIKRSPSTGNNTPSTLNQGELAFSYKSNTLFIGTEGSDSYLEIGAWSDLANLTSGTYGDATHIPILTVDQHGTVTNVTTSEISTTLSLSSDNGSNTMSLLTGTLTVTGGDGITSSIDANTSDIVLDVDTTVFRSNTALFSQYIDSNVEISGNLFVHGNVTTVDTTTLNVQDPLIYLASNNYSSDIVDIGFVGNYYDAGTDTQRHAGVMRHAGDKDFYIFYNYDKEPTSNVIDISDASFLIGNTHSNLIGNVTANLVQSDGFLAAQGTDFYGTAGYSFSGTEGGNDTGMFSPSDGVLQFWSNAEKILEGTLDAGLTLQYGANLGDHNNGSVYFGQYAGQTDQSQQAVAIGQYAGQTSQGYKSVAIGQSAGNSGQGGWSVAVGLNAANINQGNSSVAVGHRAGSDYQGGHAVAVGVNSGQNSQGYQATAVGYRAGYGNDTSQGQNSVALGAYAGYDSQVENSIAINASGNALNPTESGFYVDPIRNDVNGGNVTAYNTSTKELVNTNVVVDNNGITLANGTNITDADSGLFIDPIREDATSDDILYYNATTKEVTYGTLADLRSDVLSNGAFSWTISADNGSLYSNVGTQIAASGDSVLIGQNLDLTNTNSNRVTIGNSAGYTNQGYGTTAVGENAGYENQGFLAVAVGLNAGRSGQGNSTVAVGHTAGRNNQGSDAVAVGVAAGQNNQGQYAVAIGERAGYGDSSSQGAYAVAIGSRAGYSYQSDYSIILNASGSELNASQSGLFINPVRYTETQDEVFDGLMFYNADTKEVRYSYTLDGGSF